MIPMRIDHICLQIAHFISETLKFAIKSIISTEKSFNFAATRSNPIRNLTNCPLVAQFRREITYIGPKMNNSGEKSLPFVPKGTIQLSVSIYENI